jgi:hypothetical protein
MAEKKEFLFSERSEWTITAETEDEAMELWKNYRTDGVVTDAFELITSIGYFDEPKEIK